MEQDIVAAALAALQQLGAPEKVLEKVKSEGAGPVEVYAAMADLGADNELLEIVDGWGESRPDEQVLNDLRAWAESAELEFA